MSEIQIVFMRHGRSRAGDEGVFEGRYDSPLTQVGQEQARQRALGWRKEGVCFDQIIASTQPPVNRMGIWFAFADMGYARTVYDPDKHQWVIQELRG